MRIVLSKLHSYEPKFKCTTAEVWILQSFKYYLFCNEHKTERYQLPCFVAFVLWHDISNFSGCILFFQLHL